MREKRRDFLLHFVVRSRPASLSRTDDRFRGFFLNNRGASRTLPVESVVEIMLRLGCNSNTGIEKRATRG